MKIKFLSHSTLIIRSACFQALAEHGFQVTSDPQHSKHWQASKKTKTSIQGAIEEKLAISLKSVPSGKYKVFVESTAPVTCSSDFERAKHLEKTIMQMIILLADSALNGSKTAQNL